MKQSTYKLLHIKQILLNCLIRICRNQFRQTREYAIISELETSISIGFHVSNRIVDGDEKIYIINSITTYLAHYGNAWVSAKSIAEKFTVASANRSICTDCVQVYNRLEYIIHVSSDIIKINVRKISCGESVISLQIDVCIEKIFITK